MDATNAALLLGYCPVCGYDLPCATPHECKLEAAITAHPAMADVLRAERTAQETAHNTRRSDVRYYVRQAAYASAIRDAEDKRAELRAVFQDLARIQGLSVVTRVTVDAQGRVWCHGLAKDGTEVIMIARSAGADALGKKVAS